MSYSATAAVHEEKAVESTAEGLKAQRLPALDALRGLASLAVMWFHFTKEASSYIADGVVRASGRYGWLGVQVFFVVSGFVIPFAMYRSGYTISRYGTFLLKRITRLDPPYLLSIALIIAYQYALTTRPSYQGPPFQLSAQRVVCHFAYLNVIFGYEWFNGVFWSLAIEFQYYLTIGLLFPLLFKNGDRAKNLTLMSLILISFLPHGDAFLFPYLGFFLLGFVTLSYRLGQISRAIYLGWLAVLLVLLVFAAGLIPALVGTATASVIAWVRLDLPLFSFFGLISYSLYLLHVPFGVPVLGLIHRKTGSAYVAVAAAAVSTIAAAAIYYLVIERPSQLLSSVISYKSRSRRWTQVEFADGPVGQS